jgi:hypothetical protein
MAALRVEQLEYSRVVRKVVKMDVMSGNRMVAQLVNLRAEWKVAQSALMLAELLVLKMVNEMVVW